MLFQVSPFNPVQNFFAACAAVSGFVAAALKTQPAAPPVKKRRFEDGGPCKGVRIQAGDDFPADE